MADKARKRRLSPKQKTAALFRLWHNLKEIETEAEQMGDSELVLLAGMMELLLEERISGLSGTPSAALATMDTAQAH